MPVRKSGTHGHEPTLPTADPDVSPRADNAGAHGRPEGETQLTSSGMSESKGVHEVGPSDMPTGGGPGLRPGETSESGGVSAGRTLEQELRDKGVAGTEGGGQPEAASGSTDSEEHGDD